MDKTNYMEEAFGNKPCNSILGNKLYFLEYVAKQVLEDEVSGDVVECGVYKGGSARLLATVFKNKSILLFDSFEGMLENDELGGHSKGNFSDTNLEFVKEYLSDKQNCLFYKGWLPDSANFLTNEKFCLVHVDLDLYQSVKSAINIFWPKINNGGSMIFDDVDWKPCPGVNVAIHEYFTDPSVFEITKYELNMCSVKKLK